jgi:hypothetical protein
MYSNVKKVSVLKMFEDVRRCSRTWVRAAQMAPFTVYTLYPIPRVRASYLSRSPPNSVTFISQVRVNVSCL